MPNTLSASLKAANAKAKVYKWPNWSLLRWLDLDDFHIIDNHMRVKAWPKACLFYIFILWIAQMVSSFKWREEAGRDLVSSTFELLSSRRFGGWETLAWFWSHPAILCDHHSWILVFKILFSKSKSHSSIVLLVLPRIFSSSSIGRNVHQRGFIEWCIAGIWHTWKRQSCSSWFECSQIGAWR